MKEDHSVALRAPQPYRRTSAAAATPQDHLRFESAPNSTPAARSAAAHIRRRAMPLPTQPQGTLERVYTALYVLGASSCVKSAHLASHTGLRADAGGEAGNDHALYLHPNGRVRCVASRE
jgi:hypothetical protein